MNLFRLLLLTIFIKAVVSDEAAEDGSRQTAGIRTRKHDPPQQHVTTTTEDNNERHHMKEDEESSTSTGSTDKASASQKEHPNVDPEVLNDLASSTADEGVDMERRFTVLELLCVYFAAPLIGFGYVFFLCIKNGTCDINELFEKSYDDKKK